MNAFLLRRYIFPAYHKLKRTMVMERYNELEGNQWKNKEELDFLQATKLQRLLTHAYKTVPFYRKRFDDLGIDIEKLHRTENSMQIPVLTKKSINDNRERMVSKRLDGNKLISNSTSGSTGENLYFYYDSRSSAYRKATEIRNQKWLGIRLGDRSVRLWGAPMDLDKAAAIRGRMHGLVNNIMFLSSYQLSDNKLDEYVRRLNSFKPKLFISYPGPITVFSNYLIEKGKKVPSIEAIICSAETLFSWQREIIEEAFDCRVYNRYGCREFGDIAQECLKREGLHIHTDRFVLEILNEELKNAKEGETGELVITDLDNYGMPMIRYRIGDRGALKRGLCSCGRSLPLLAEIEGRTLDVVRAPNGNQLGGTFWTLLFRSRPGFKSFQVTQDKLNEIVVKYIKDRKSQDIDIDFFKKQISEKCGENFKVHFLEVASIPETSSGKTRFVVSKIRELA